jgi:hypothetical protein
LEPAAKGKRCPYLSGEDDEAKLLDFRDLVLVRFLHVF